MNLKKWDFGFRYETAIVILVWWGMAIFNISKGKSATAGLCIAASVLPVLVFVFDLLKRHSDKWTVAANWLAIVLMPAILSITWYILFRNILQHVIFKMFITIVFSLILLVMDLPVAVVAIGQLRNWLGRLIAVCYFNMVLLSSTVIELKPQGINVLITSGLMAAIATFLAAILIAKRWSFSFNPDLKWQGSIVTLIWLVLFCLIFAFWAEFCGQGNSLGEILLKPDLAPLKPTWVSFCRAIEAGVFEETNRYLTILALIAGFAYSRYRVQIALIVSAIFFGLLHFTNLGGQAFAATLNQAVYAAALGLVFAIMYLYTGKLWLAMLYHFGIDFLNYAVNGGVKAQVWSGTLSDWVSSFVLVLVPVAIAVWMMTGKRKQVMDENIDEKLKTNEWQIGLS